MLAALKSMFRRKPQPRPGSAAHAHQGLMASYEAYKLARRDRPRQHYQPHGYSGDAAIIGSADLMHRRTRDLARNTSPAKRVVGALVDLVVGTGIETHAWPFAPSEMMEILAEIESLQVGELGPRLSYALESDDLFEEWSSDPTQFDVEGRLSWPEMQRMLMQESVLVGNGLLIRSFRKDYSLVPLAYQIIEREQLDESQDRPASDVNNKIVGGVEFDSNNRTVAYHIYLDHPHDFFGIGQSAMLGAGSVLAAGNRRMRVPAERVIDLALFHRPSASLGVSWLDACGQAMFDRDSYMDSEIKSAALNAVFALAAYLEDPDKSPGLGLDDGLDDLDGNSNRQFKVGHSPIAAMLGKDEKLEMISTTRPNKDAGPFMKLLDRDIAGAVGLSYYSATGDYESTNYTSAKGAKQDEDLHIAPLQGWFATRVALRVRKDFNRMAAAGGLFRSVSPAEFRRNERTYQRFEAVGNGRDLIDPYKEGEARTGRLRTGMSTYKEEQARMGKHWLRTLAQLAIERKVAANVFGVTLDYSKGGGDGNASGQQSDAAEQQAQRIADRLAMILGDNLRAA